jgi:1-phosphofructokinase
MSVKVFGDGCLHIVTKLKNHMDKFSIGDIEISSGGSATNVVLQLKKLGISPEFYGIVGNDPNGRLFIELLEREEINTNHIIQEGSTHKVLISTNPPKEANLTIDIGEIPIEKLNSLVSKVNKEDLVYLPGFNTYEPLLKEVSKKGCTIFTDYGHLSLEEDQLEYIEGLKRVTGLADIVLASGFKYDKSLFKEIIPIIKESRCKTLIITFSGRCVLVITNSGEELYFEFQRKEVTNNIGAGDSFMASLIFGYYKGLPIEESIQLAHNVASLRIQFFNHIPTLQEIEEFCKLEV